MVYILVPSRAKTIPRQSVDSELNSITIDVDRELTYENNDSKLDSQVPNSRRNPDSDGEKRIKVKGGKEIETIDECHGCNTF